MSDCNHEEADTRMMVDVEHLLVSGAKTIGIFRTGVWATSLQPQQNLSSPSDLEKKEHLYIHKLETLYPLGLNKDNPFGLPILSA